MDTPEQKNTNTKNGHACPPGHCCDCNGCGMYGSYPMRRYWRRHFLILILGVIAAFFVGMKLGELKGYVMSQYGMMPMEHHGWMQHQGMYDYGVQTTTPIQPTVPTPAQ